MSIFLCATVSEGFGLTGLEAMSCGAVLVSSDYDGVREYAINGVNALLSPIRDSNSLVQNVALVFEDELLRNRLSKNGIQSARELTWESAMDKLETYLNSIDNN